VSDREKGIIGIIARSYQKQKPPYLISWLIEDHPRHLSWGDLQGEIEYPQDIYAIVEGIFDLINMNRYFATVALLGTEVDTRWFQGRFPEGQMFYIFLDPDAKEQAATVSIKLRNAGFQARTFFLHKEPGDMNKGEFEELCCALSIWRDEDYSRIRI
jgi:hypothetical protein